MSEEDWRGIMFMVVWWTVMGAVIVGIRYAMGMPL